MKITPYINSEVTALSRMSFKALIQLNQSPCLSKDVSLDLFWHTARFFSDPRPSWIGYLTFVSKRDYPGEASVNMLPIIDIDPTNLSCIYSALDFITDLLQTAPVAQIHTNSSLIEFEHCSSARWISYYDVFCWEHCGIDSWIRFRNST